MSRGNSQVLPPKRPAQPLLQVVGGTILLGAANSLSPSAGFAGLGGTSELAPALSLVQLTSGRRCRLRIHGQDDVLGRMHTDSVQGFLPLRDGQDVQGVRVKTDGGVSRRLSEHQVLFQGESGKWPRRATSRRKWALFNALACWNERQLGRQRQTGSS